MATPTSSTDYVARHLRFGWWSLFVFLLLGLTLETMHGFKIGFYLDVSNTTRRLMWTLAHAHGALLALIHIIAALVLQAFPQIATAQRSVVSGTLIGASVLLPGGFFLSGVSFYSGDPGFGIALVPVGAMCLAVAVFQLARASAGVITRTHGDMAVAQRATSATGKSTKRSGH